MELIKAIKPGGSYPERSVKQNTRFSAAGSEVKIRHLLINSTERMKGFALDVGIDPFFAQLGEGTSEWRALQGYVGAMTATRISFSAALYLRASSLAEYLILGMCQSSAQMSINGLSVKSRDYFLIMPGAHVDVFTRKPAKLCLVKIPLAEIETEIGDLYPAFMRAMDKRKVYVGGSQTDSGHFRRWFQTWKMASSGRNQSSPTAILPLLSGIVFSSLKSIALDLQRRADEDLTDSDWSDCGSKRLIDYFHDNPEDWISIEEACEISGLGRRNLYYQFNKYTGLSPQKYFSRIRLSYLRQELVGGDLSITELAQKYSFYHLGDFASGYRALYGESPSDTRKNARKSRQKKSRERLIRSTAPAHVSNG